MDSRDYYKEIVKRSCSGTRKRNESRVETIPRSMVINKEEINRIKMKRTTISSIRSGAFSLSGFDVDVLVPHVSENVQVSQELSDGISRFKQEYIVPNNHDQSYDYDGLAKGLVEFDNNKGNVDFNKNVFYLLENLDSMNVDRTLEALDDEKYDYKYYVTSDNGEKVSCSFKYMLLKEGFYDIKLNLDKFNTDSEYTEEINKLLLNNESAFEKAQDNLRSSMKNITRDKIHAMNSINLAFAATEGLYNQKVDELNSILDKDGVSDGLGKGVKK